MGIPKLQSEASPHLLNEPRAVAGASGLETQARVLLDQGVWVDGSTQPHLIEEIQRMARLVGRDVSPVVHLMPCLNAAVFDCRYSRIPEGIHQLYIGLPLLAILTRAQLQAIIVHEFSHYQHPLSGLTKRLSLLRGAAGQKLLGLGRPNGRVALLQAPLGACLGTFLLASGLFLRRQEFAADALAACHCGVGVVLEALKVVVCNQAAFNSFMQDHYLPALHAYGRIEMAEGFRQFTANTDAAWREALDQESACAASLKRFLQDHPTLPERVGALEKIKNISAAHQDDTPALSLIEDLPAVEEQLAGLLRNQLVSPMSSVLTTAPIH